MRIAWFAPGPDDAALELARTQVVDRFDQGTAHEFVWRHFRAPYDVTVFELADSPSHAFVWAYLFHYPGVVVLRAASLQHSRSAALIQQHRRPHLRDERSFSGWDLLRAPLMASRLVVVHDEPTAQDLRRRLPELSVRVVAIGVTAIPTSAGAGLSRFHDGSSRTDVIEHAATRARESGASVVLAGGISDLHQDDVMIALEWPPAAAPPVVALRAMAAGLPTVVLETESIAAWPTLDPQTWQPRGYVAGGEPIAISIDPRDEEHSLMLAMRRLSSDAALRTRLGAAASAWAHRNAAATAAAAAWEPVLHEATQRAPAIAPPALPAHLTADGTTAARAILAEFGVGLSFLR